MDIGLTTIEIIKVLQEEANRITQMMKSLETRRRTGRLNSSIRVSYINNTFTVSAMNYGKFQDEGTFSNKRITKVSSSVWPVYVPRTNRKGRGIFPLNFTKPLEKIDGKSIISKIKPFIIKNITEEIKKNIK